MSVDDLTWETCVEANDWNIQVPPEYAEMTSIKEGECFSLSCSTRFKSFRLKVEGKKATNNVTHEEDGKIFLTYESIVTNGWHVIPREYVEMLCLQENDKFFIRARTNQIRLLNADYYDSNGELMESED